MQVHPYSIGKKRTQASKIVCLLAGLVLGCKGYDVVDFQAERCQQAPVGEIQATDRGNLRWNFELANLNRELGVEPMRVVWTIDGADYVAQRVFYQFDKRGEQKVTVVMTNLCFMQTVKEATIVVR